MITIIIPTMNRSDFVIRLLRYYKSVNFQGYLCIGDSSNREHLEPTKKAIEEHRGKLNIIYREYPGQNNSVCIQQLIDLAPTPYAAFSADDDFLVPPALDKCARFLEDHPAYSSAHGKGLSIILKSGGVYGKVASVSHYAQPEVEDENASQRLLAHMQNYTVTLFSVQRTATWKAMYRDITRLTDIRFTELLPCCLSIIEGKAKELDYLYLVRQGHYRRYLLPQKTDWTEGPNYHQSYQVFRDCLVQALSSRDSISPEKVGKVVERAFSLYLKNSFKKSWPNRFGVPRFLQATSVIPGVQKTRRALWHLLRSLKVVARDEIQPNALLSPSSFFHDDFLPIYRSVTEKPIESGVQEL
jgi:glycosyltransferase domain-containing protein